MGYYTYYTGQFIGDVTLRNPNDNACLQGGSSVNLRIIYSNKGGAEMRNLFNQLL